ncbi:MAG: SRPBCC family protein [Bacteroidetes bacterium]|nr:SRPBCC family protein [Bacteroidota bacterium]MBS1649607.1 SRPBCC family protein [Bacteroidota bacterium]
MPTQYSFITKWEIKAPIEDVWNAIYLSNNWPNWWKGVLVVKDISTGNTNGIGDVKRYTWKSALPYKLTFNMKLTENKLYEKLSGIAFGELEGNGTWIFTHKNNITYIEYHWNVITNKWWMNIFSFLLKPAFQYNHDVVMRWGAKGLAKKLNTELISY